MRTNISPPKQRYKSEGGKFLPALCNILGILILLTVIAAFLSMTIPRSLGYGVYNVVSGEMAPKIPAGSIIYVERVEPEAVAAGDVIAFRSGGDVASLRVVENRFGKGEYVTKGDADAGENVTTVPYAELIGRVVRHFPVFGAMMTLFSATVGKIYAVILAACGVMFNILAGRMRDWQREKLRRRRQEEITDGADDLSASEITAIPPVREKNVRTAAGAHAAAGRARRSGQTVRGVLMVILAAVFIVSSIGAWMILRQYRQGDAVYAELSSRYTKASPVAETVAEEGEDPAAEKAESEPATAAADLLTAPIQVDFEALLGENSDVIGWIYCEDTAINYPVVRGENNEYYLHRGLDRNYSAFGTIFEETGNRPDFQDYTTFLYGHHMRNGSMFAGLEKWTAQEYYEEHPVMWLLTPARDYRLDLVAGYTTDAYSDTYTIFREAGPNLDDYLKAALEKSNFSAKTELPADGRYLILSTCAYVFDDARYVIQCLMVPADSAGGVPLTDRQAGLN